MMITNRKRKASQRDNIFTKTSANIKKSPSKSRNSSKSSFMQRSKSKDELDELYSRRVESVKAKYEKLLKKNPNKLIAPDIIKELKRCESCFDFEDKPGMIFCEYCEDGYHMYCLTPKLERKPVGAFVCSNCQGHLDSEEAVPTKLKGINKTIKRAQKKCLTCKEQIQEKRRSVSVDKNYEEDSHNSIEENSLKNCHKCLQDFHLKCFRKDWADSVLGASKSNFKKGYGKCKIICDNCENRIQNTMKVTRISDYFKLQKNPNPKNFGGFKNMSNFKTTLSNNSKPSFTKNKINYDNLSETTSEDSTNHPSVITKNTDNSAKFKIPKDLTKEQKKTLQESLFRALEVKGITFGDDLNFEDKDCPTSMNDASLEVGIQKISEYNKQIYYKFKQKTRVAEYPPLEVVDDDLQGFIVKATDDVPYLTLICEYTGDVTQTRNKIFDKNDSIMDLIKTPSSSTSLVICPEKKSNIARFLSGINNYNEKSAKKQNVRSIKYDIDGTVHVLLYAARTIKKHEVLYYDYNAGGHHTYPTQHFI